MIRISALNDSSDDDESQSISKSRPTTKEAQESAALALYNRALDLLKRGDENGAKNTFLQLLEAPFIKNAEPSTESEVLVDPGLVVKYSSYKNLGSMAAHREEYETAMTYYLEAVMVDSSDVTVWYKIGTIAKKLHNYPLARHAFEQGLVCQPRHWPCLDNVITVLYALYNYDACLVYIARALERDPGYIKGISFMEKILEEQPSLRRHMGHHFTSCDQSIFTNEVDQDEADEYIDEAVAMRKKKQELCQPKERPTVKFTQPLTAFTWHKLGSCFMSLYDHIASSEPPITYSCKVDLKENLKLQTEAEESPTAPEVITDVPASSTTTPSTPPTTTSTSTTTTSTSTTTTTTTTTATPALESSQIQATEEASLLPTETANKVPESEKEKEGGTGEISDVDHMQVETSKMENVLTTSETREREISKRGPKRKKFIADNSEKRRSARVRNTGSKPVEDQFKIQELLVNLLPTSMTQVRVEDEGTESSQEEPMDVTSQENSTQHTSQDSGTDGAEDGASRVTELRDTEQTEVLDFLEKHQNNSGIIDLLNEYLIILSQRAHLSWPEGLAQIYIKCYTRLHKHIQYPGYLCKDSSHERIRNMSKMNLVHAELKVDRWVGTKSRASPPRRSGGGSQGLGSNFAGPTFRSDLVYLEGVSQCQDIFDDEWINFVIRVFWMSAKFRMLEGKTAESITDYECTSSYLEIAEKESNGQVTLALPHIQHDKEVTLEKVKQQVELLKRCQSQDKMQGLHDSGEYDKVIQLLLETFENPAANKVLENEERHAQIILLVESLFKMKDYKRCIIWGEVSLNEAIQKYNTASTNQARDEWANTAVQLMDGMDKAISAEQSAIRSLTSKCLVRFTQNLLLIIEAAFDVPESAHEMGIPSMLPWILIYKLIYFEECQQGEGVMEGEGVQVDHSGSLSLLETAHEQLGRRSWCSNCDGALLLFIVSEIVKEVQKDEEEITGWGDYDHILEQCFFCLYGHPNRRRAKHLQDHSSSQISLTWTRANHVFAYFKPQTMPEYDSLKTSTVSGELEALLRRIYIMIPSDTKPSLTVEQITAYIEGTANEPPDIPDGQEFSMPIVGELYYLLADYYFKNKEQGKAIKFYLQDLCVNPDRFDSWAGMALARASRLEQKLSLSELKAENKTEGSIWKHAIASLRCFQRALQLDNTNSKLWIEYGALAYQLHAHASRQLKQLRGDGLLHKQVMYPLTGPSLEEATSNRTEMLTIAGNCYRKAGECEADDHEEEWLHHYMLGKVAEKKGEPPVHYLEHYKQALYFLHEDRARYPRKITYIYSPPHLAVETLEVFYRMHVSVIKYMMRHAEDIPYTLFESYIKEAAEGPFATGKEKEKKAKDRDSSIDDSHLLSPIISSVNPLSTGSTPCGTSTPNGRATKHHSARMDHTYSRQRSMDSSRSDAENSNEAVIEASRHRRMVTNQRTGVAISASDSMDSMQSPVAIVLSESPLKSKQNVPEESKAKPEPTEGQKTENNENKQEKCSAEASSEGDVQRTQALPNSEKESVSSDNSGVEESKTSSKSSNSFSMAAILDSDSKAVTSSCQNTGPNEEPSKQREEGSGDLPDTTVEEEMDTGGPNPETVPMSNVQGKEAEASVSTSNSAANSNQESCKDSEKISKEGIEATTEKTKPSKPDVDTKAEIDSSNDQKDTPNSLSKKEAPTASESQEKNNDVDDSALTDSLDAPKGLEDLEKQIKKETLVPLTELVSEGSSQDSTTVAELEKLKSEISFLNAGSSEPSGVPSNVFSSSYDDMMIKVEKEDSVDGSAHAETEASRDQETKEKEKEEGDISQNQALEALKSELQMLSEASGSFVVPDYIGQDDKSQANIAGSQGFDVSEFGLSESQESMDEDPERKPGHVERSGSAPKKGVTNDDLSNLEKLESSLQKMETDELQRKEEGVKEEKKAEVDDPKSSPLEPDSSRSTAMQTPDSENKSSEANTQDKEKEIHPTTSGESKTSSSLDETEVKKSQNEKPTESIDTVEKVSRQGIEKDKMVTLSDEKSAAENKTDDQPKTNPENSSNVEQPSQGLHDKAANGNENKSEKSEKPDEKGDAKIDPDKGEDEAEKGDKKNDGATEKVDGTDQRSNKERYTAIMSQCMKALELCLSRFPHHYKSLYRMAYIYYHCKEFKNDEHAKDMLLGNPNWSHLKHMASPGLFQDRKSTNFFQGLWRIPIEEIDRSGSFACHMLRSLQLLFPILKDLKDHRTLFSIHTMLSKNPDAGKKYLRDSDRVELSRLAMVYTIDILEELVSVKALEKEQEVKIAYLLDLFKVWQYCVKAHQHSHSLNKLMRKAFFSLMKDQIEDEPSVLEQAIRFCQKRQELVKSPTTPDPCRSVHGTPTSLLSSHPLAGVSGIQQGEGQRGISESVRSMKGITLIPGTTRGTGPAVKSLKPCTVRLTAPLKSKFSGSATMPKSSHSSKTIDGLAKKLTVSNVLKKPDPKKSTGLSASSSTSSTGSKSNKASTSAMSNASLYSGFTAAQLASINNPQALAMYAKMAQMSPQAFLQAQYGAAQEAMLSQMAMASSLGIPLASMAYMYPQMAMDPTMWSSYAAAQAFAEATAKTSASQGQRHGTTMASTAKSTVVTTTASSQRPSTKVSRPATSSTGAEPPRKQIRTDSGSIDRPMSLTKHDQPTSSKGQTTLVKSYKPATSSVGDKALALTTRTMQNTMGTMGSSQQSVASSGSQRTVVSSIMKPGVVIGQKQGAAPQKPAKLKLSTTASELYAVRMSSALARITSTTTPSSPHPTIRAPPPKVQRMGEPSSSSVASGSLSHLDLLASAAQTHRTMFQPTAKPTMAKSGPSSTSPSNRAPTYKAPPAKSLIKRSPHYRPNRGSNQTKAPQSKSQGSSQAAKQGIAKPVSIKGPPTKLHSVSGMHHAGLTQPGQVTTAKQSHMVTTSQQVRTAQAMPTAGGGIQGSQQALKMASPIAIPTGQPIHARLLAQHLTGNSGVRPPPAYANVRTVSPSGQRTGVSGGSGSRTGNAGGFGRGKPSHPATLASRMQDDSSSDDCIIISSGHDSDSN